MNSIFLAGFADEVEKVACGVASDGGSLWSDRFKGTPLHEPALNLEIQQANSDMQFDEMEAQRREREAQEGNVWDQRRKAEDQFRLARKRLEKQLLVARLQQEASDKEEGWQGLDEVPKAKPVGRPPEPMATQVQQGAVQQDFPQSG